MKYLNQNTYIFRIFILVIIIIALFIICRLIIKKLNLNISDKKLAGLIIIIYIFYNIIYGLFFT